MARSAAALAVLLTVSLSADVHALVGKALFRGASWRPEKGLHMIDMETGAVDTITLDGIDVGKFSPDGRRIYTVQSGTLYEMHNDGTNRRTVCTGVSMVYNSSTNLCITDAGAFWLSDGGNINRCIIASGAKSVVATITGDYYQGLWLSTSGRRGMAWIRNNATEHRYPFFEFPATFSSPAVKWADIWGHGHCIAQDGQTVIISDWRHACNTIPTCTDYGDHRTFMIYDFDQINLTSSAGLIKSMPNGDATGATGTAGLHACVNNSDYLFYDAGGCMWPPEDIGGCDTCQRAWVTNWRTEEHWQVPNLPCHNMYSNDFWLGTLPPPTATQPYIALSTSSVVFMDTTLPVPSQDVTVSNSGVGTLGQVSTAISPAAAWLSVTVQGSGGNTQTIRNAVDPSGLPPGAHATVVTVSGGGATNSAQYAVTLNVALTIPAPSGLTATVGGAANNDVSLSWTDNSGSEDGFTIQRQRLGAGTWVSVASVGSDVTGWTNAGLTLNTYLYRVAAYLGTDTSGWSNVDTALVVGLPSVTVTSPAAGDTLQGGTVCRIRWSATIVDNVEILYTLDNEETWFTINPQGGVVRADSLWGNFPWTVPEVAASGVIVRVQQYQQALTGANTGAFTIVGSGTTVAAHARAAGNLQPLNRAVVATNRLPLLVPRGATLIRVYGLDGSLHHVVDLTRDEVVPRLGSGCWMVRVE